jgi:hypothetical protein
VIRLWRRSICIALVAAAIFGCTSPEAERTRGGGRGADVGNHPAGPVEIHAGADIYYGTPTQGQGIGRHADIGGAVPARVR